MILGNRVMIKEGSHWHRITRQKPSINVMRTSTRHSTTGPDQGDLSR